LADISRGLVAQEQGQARIVPRWISGE